MDVIVKKLNEENAYILKDYLKKTYNKLDRTNNHREYIFKLRDNEIFIKSGFNYFVILKEDDDLKSFCIYEPLTHEQVEDTLENESEFYEDNELEIMYKYISDINLNSTSIYINIIESFDDGYGSKLVNYLKSNYSKIMLYADSDACGFWDKMKFFKVFGYTYIYPPKAIKEIHFNLENIEDIAWIPGVKF